MLPAQQSMLLSRKRKPADYGTDVDNGNEGNEDTSPPPSSRRRPQKRGRSLQQPATATIDDDEGDDKKRHWTKAETKQFVHALMGPDGYWDKFTKNPNGTFKKVSRQLVTSGKSISLCLEIAEKHFPNRFNAKALKSKFDRLKKTYRSLNALVEWTGGGGDPDLENRLHLAQSSRTSKIDVKGLTSKVIADWTVEMPWLYELFNDRYAASFPLLHYPHNSPQVT